jgi:hypothetical protein
MTRAREKLIFALFLPIMAVVVGLSVGRAEAAAIDGSMTQKAIVGAEGAFVAGQAAINGFGSQGFLQKIADRRNDKLIPKNDRRYPLCKHLYVTSTDRRYTECVVKNYGYPRDVYDDDRRDNRYDKDRYDKNGKGHRDRDKFSDRREDKRYPRCKHIQNASSRRYKECVSKYYDKDRHGKDKGKGRR